MDSSQIADALMTIMMGIMAIILCYMMISCSISIIKGNISFSTCIVSGMITLFLYGICGTFYFLSAIGVAGPVLYITAGAAYILAQISMIFTFMTRIKKAFNGSYLAISKCTNNILYGSWICLIVLGLVLLVSNYILPVVWVGIFASIWILCYITLSILLITLFIRKLQFLSLKSDCTESSFIALDFIDTAIKNGLLVSIAIISSFIFPTIALTLKLTMPIYVRRMAIFWIAVDATVTSLSIFLLFSFNQRIYSVLCFKVHSKCKQIHLIHLKSDLPSDNRLPMRNVGSMSNSDEDMSADINCAELQSQTTRNHTTHITELNLNLMRCASDPIPSQHRKQVNLSNVLENQAFALSNPVNKTCTHQSKNKVIIKSIVQPNPDVYSINSNNSNPLPGSSKSNELRLNSHAYSTSV